MAYSCPISRYRVDARLVRIVAFEILALSSAYVLFSSPVWMLFLAFDFLMRLTRNARLSPLTFAAAYVEKTVGITPLYTDEAPKRFALGLGIAVVIVTLTAHFFGLLSVAKGAAFVLIVCSFLEALFDFCIGCKLYYGMKLLKVIKNDRNID